MPTFAHGRNTVIFYRGYNLAQYLKEVNWSGELDTPETTAFGSTTRSYVVGFVNRTASCSGMYSSTQVGDLEVHVDNFMSAALGSATPGWLLYGPIGGAIGTPVGAPGKAGYADNNSYAVTGSVTDVVGIACDFQFSTFYYDFQTYFWVDPADVSKTGNGTHAWTLDRTVGEPTSGKTFKIWLQGLNRSSVSVTMQLKHSADNITWSAVLDSSVAPAGTPWNIAWTGTTLNRYIRAEIVVTGSTGTPVHQVAGVRYTSLV